MNTNKQSVQDVVMCGSIVETEQFISSVQTV